MGDEPDDAREYARLLRFLTRPGPSFELALARVDDPVRARRIRQRLARDAAAASCRVSTLALDRADDRVDLVERMASTFDGDALFVTGLEHLLLDELGARRESPAVSNFNQQRDKLPERLRGRVLIWLPEFAFVAYSESLPDLAEFALTVAHLRERSAALDTVRLMELGGWMTFADEQARAGIARQAEVLTRMHATASGRAAAELAGDIGQLWLQLGEIDIAGEWTERAAAEFESLGELGEAARELRRLAAAQLFSEHEAALELADRAAEHARAVGAHAELAKALTVRADVLTMQGELDRARELLRDEVLPIFEQRQVEPEIAATLDRLADNALMRGDLDDALGLRRQQREVVLRLADTHALAVSDRKLAAILIERGELDGALTILRDAVLPALADDRERAIAWGKIADIEFARGELDDAREIREREQLPVFERIGDVRELAVTWAKLADIARTGGQFDEAERILRTRVRPVFERLDDALGLLVVERQLDALRDAPLLPSPLA